MPDCMTFPDTVEEFMQKYKVVDTEQVYTNGTEFVPIFRMRQWFQHEPQRKRGKWKQVHVGGFTPGGNSLSVCSECGWEFGTHMIYPDYNFCPNCGAKME